MCFPSSNPENSPYLLRGHNPYRTKHILRLISSTPLFSQVPSRWSNPHPSPPKPQNTHIVLAFQSKLLLWNCYSILGSLPMVCECSLPCYYCNYSLVGFPFKTDFYCCLIFKLYLNFKINIKLILFLCFLSSPQLPSPVIQTESGDPTMRLLILHCVYQVLLFPNVKWDKIRWDEMSWDETR